MHILEPYLKKHNVASPLVSEWHRAVSMVIVIPCYNEPNLNETLEALRCCSPIHKHVEVILLINSGEQCSEAVKTQNRVSYNMVLSEFPFDPLAYINFKPWIIEGIRKKHAGAGYARKLGMDMAVSLFNSIENSNGLIVSLDADTLVDKNYLSELEKVYLDKDLDGGTIHFEHPLSSSGSPENMAILLYELHLRYYHNALKAIGFPYHYYTIGSAFFIRARTYARFGGMNRRQGGEDFYFLHKVLPNLRYITIVSTKVMPSSRASDRVPFGTGPRIKQYLQNGKMLTYDWHAFNQLKTFFTKTPAFYSQGDQKLENLIKHFNEPLQSFLIQNEAVEKLIEIKRNTSNYQSFNKRFYGYFNAFFIVKYLNESHQTRYQMQDVFKESSSFIKQHFNLNFDSPYALLMHFRKLDSEENFKK